MPVETIVAVCATSPAFGQPHTDREQAEPLQDVVEPAGQPVLGVALHRHVIRDVDGLDRSGLLRDFELLVHIGRSFHATWSSMSSLYMWVPWPLPPRAW